MSEQLKNMRVAFVAILALAAPVSAVSAEEMIIQPGMYEVTVGVAGNNMKARACYSDSDVKDLPSVVRTLEEPLMRKSCAVEILSQSMGKAEWRMECRSDFVSRTTVGSLAWAPTQFNGKFVRTMGEIKMESPIDAKRVGDCH